MHDFADSFGGQADGMALKAKPKHVTQADVLRQATHHRDLIGDTNCRSKLGIHECRFFIARM